MPTDMDKTTAALSRYLAEVDRTSRTGRATEHSYRGALETLFAALLPGLRAVNEPSRVECGAPDYALLRRALPVAYVETKTPGDDDLDGRRPSGHKPQFDRYKASLRNVLFTDYLDFRLFLDARPAAAVRIADLAPDGRVVPLPEAFPRFLELLSALSAAVPPAITSAPQLARLMAAKARLLQEAALRFLERNEPSPDAPRTALGKLVRDFRRLLLPDLGFPEFSDIYAQTVTYGMLAARLHDDTPEDFSREEAARRIPRSSRILKNLFGNLASDLEEGVAWAVDDLAALFAASDVARIMSAYGRAAGRSDPTVHFYEDFLAAYDAGLRKDRGVWYTPLPVVRFIVRAVDSLLQSAFSLPDGLADASTADISPFPTRQDAASPMPPPGGRPSPAAAARGDARPPSATPPLARRDHRVQLLDPATGTGTFLAECIRFVHDRFQTTGHGGEWPGYVADHLLPRLHGFEIVMASYAMAHLKLDLVLRETLPGIPPDPNRRFNIFLTDSLSGDSHGAYRQMNLISLAEEAEAAERVKRDTPVMVVLGNPPYNGESQNKSAFIMRLMEAYKKEPGGREKLREKNPKWINDDYVKFIRLAEDYIQRNGSGIIAFINPHGWLDAPTFRGMRWRLMQTFDQIYVLNLHGNAKKKETTPDGSKDENVFDIMQGVCINLFIKTERASIPPPRENAAFSMPTSTVPARKNSLFSTPTLSKTSLGRNSPPPNLRASSFPRISLSKRNTTRGFLSLNSCPSMGWVSSPSATESRFKIHCRELRLSFRILPHFQKQICA